jgi:hypothetical protein
MRAKRADYFACGTLVVWKASDPYNPVIFRRGDVADAELAVPGWRMPIDALFV